MEILDFNAFQFNEKKRSAIFDFDGTLISGKRKFTPEWEWSFSNVVEKLHQEYKFSTFKGVSGGAQIIIMTNQLKYSKEVLLKIKDVTSHFKFPYRVVISTQRDSNRKPGTGSRRYVVPSDRRAESESFYCGDAAGRKGDFSDSDLWYSRNLGLAFISPEAYFNNTFPSDTFPLIPYRNIDYDLIEKIRHICQTYDGILLVGLPGSGKSYIRKMCLNFCQEIGIETVVINNDEKLKGKFKPGIFLINDNTNLTEKSREGYDNLIILWLDLDVSVCKRGIEYRVWAESGRHITDVVLYTMRKKLEPPSMSENDIYLSTRPIFEDTHSYLF